MYFVIGSRCPQYLNIVRFHGNWSIWSTRLLSIRVSSLMSYILELVLFHFCLFSFRPIRIAVRMPSSLFEQRLFAFDGLLCFIETHRSG